MSGSITAKRRGSTTFYFILLSVIRIKVATEATVVPNMLIDPPETDLTMLPGQSLSLTCRSSAPVVWETDLENEHVKKRLFLSKQNSLKYRIFDSLTDKSDHPYKTVLELREIDYQFVGYYYCINEEALYMHKHTSDFMSMTPEKRLVFLLEKGHALRTYLFVEDRNHPLVESDSVEYDKQQNSVLIRCKPTSKDFTVKLFEKQARNGEETRKEILANFSIYDGFQLRFSEVNSNNYECVTNGSVTTFFVNHFYINEPTIRSETGKFGFENRELVLNCSVEFSYFARVTMTWILPNNGTAVKEKRVEIIEPEITEQQIVSVTRHRYSKNVAVGILKVKALDKRKDSGDYVCKVEDVYRPNFHNSTTFGVEVVEEDHKYKKVAIATFVVIFVFVVFTVRLWIGVQRERKLVQELKAAGLADFPDGKIESINPILRLNEQADLLPYNRKYEFPKQKLTFCEKLGEGEFGVVIKAYARGILPGTDEETPVAVKMVKEKRNLGAMRALVSELKILVHLGQHLNIVNLLGAVTENIAQRELFVIVEYCPLGNLHRFLRKHRGSFINQMDYDNDKIDSSILANNRRILNGYSSPSEASDAVQVKESEITFTTTDLLSWSFQVARGMHYLSCRNVVHSDLAARNVLLTEDNVVKVCDFGLSRTMYRNVYQKEGTEPLPFRWMAIESIQSRVFSTYSDVWSFGVFMWELFSHGDVPYHPEILHDYSELPPRLTSGYRLTKPKFATDQIYNIMQCCWFWQPNTRPLFNRLEKAIAEMLPNDEVSRFVQLNQPYLLMNESKGVGGHDDLLAKMSSTIDNCGFHESSDGLEDFEMYLQPSQYVEVQSSSMDVCTVFA